MSRQIAWPRVATFTIGFAYLWLSLGSLALVMPKAGLDPSWQSILVHAWVVGWQWGVDLIDNFGPYGFLYAREFHPAAVGIMLALNVAMAAVLVVAWLLLVGGLRFPTQLVLSLAFLFAMAGRREVFYLSFPFLLALTELRRPRPAPLTVRVSLVLATALAGLVKWTFPVVGLAICALLDFDGARCRRWPWHLPLALATMAALYLLAGQQFANLPELLTLTLDQTAGFADAMASGKSSEIYQFLALVAVGLGLVGTALLLSPADFWRRAVLLLVLILPLFVAFKIGYVRHDATHSPSAWSMFGLILIGYYAISADGLHRFLGLAILFVALCSLGAATYYRPLPSSVFARLVLVDGPLANTRHALAIAGGWSRWKTVMTSQWEAARTRIREQRPLPKLKGTVDSIPPLQANILAWSLDYRPRPTLQEHQAYTPLTLAADEAFFVSELAPEYLLFRPGSIDKRYPSLAEGALWPLLLSRYRIERQIDDVLVLERRTSRAEPFAGSTSRQDRVDWERWTVLQPEEAAAAFIRVRVEATMFGRLMNFLFRPAFVTIEVRLNDGRRHSHRLPRGLAAAGFLLSPYVVTAAEYEALAVGDRALDAARVREFRLLREPGRAAEFESGFDIEVTRLDLQQFAADVQPPQ
jgi:hypothetical protein